MPQDILPIWVVELAVVLGFQSHYVPKGKELHFLPSWPGSLLPCTNKYFKNVV